MPKASKIRPNKVIHPNSRVAAQLSRKAHHEQKVEKRHKNKCSKYEVLGEKLKWFQENLDEDKTSYTKAEACQLVEKYLDRFSEELEQIELVNSMKGRDGKQHASRVQAIKMTKEMEAKEYTTTGFEMPNIVNGKNLKYFREWTGELRYLPNIKLCTITSASADASKDTKDNSKMDTEVEDTVESKDPTEGSDDSDKDSSS